MWRRPEPGFGWLRPETAKSGNCGISSLAGKRCVCPRASRADCMERVGEVTMVVVTFVIDYKPDLSNTL